MNEPKSNGRRVAALVLCTLALLLLGAGCREAASTAGKCAPAPTDDACVACAKSACCASSLACVHEPACRCRIACRTVGPDECTPAAAERCGPAGATYDTAVACIEAHCAVPCAPGNGGST